jgi:hypothetical protein
MSGKSASPAKPSLLERPYSERKQIIVVDDGDPSLLPGAGEALKKAHAKEARFYGVLTGLGGFSATTGLRLALAGTLSAPLIPLAAGATAVWTGHTLLEHIREWRRLGIDALPVAHSEAEALLAFPFGHPIDNTLYVGHPKAKPLYYPAAQFHRKLFEHKTAEAIRLLRSLGATRIKVESVEGWSSEFFSQLDLPLSAKGDQATAEVSGNRGVESHILWEEHLPGTTTAALPENLVWYEHEPMWQSVAEGRLTYKSTDFRLDVAYKDDYGINAQLNQKVALTKVSLGGKFQEHKSTLWRMEGEFR